MTSSLADGDDVAGWAALGELYHRYLTGLLLATVSRVGPAAASEVVFHTFRRQHLEQFLPGLHKLGLAELPPAVACAQYHVLSNALGGVRVVWIPESDTKSWVRYLPPRWIFDGTAVCAIPTEVSRAMLRGWHGHNGVSLGNPRLGFVCTMQTTDGQPGLEGYYIEADDPLAEADRVRFRPGERPRQRTRALPLPAWDGTRLAKVERNYSTNYIRSILPELCSVLGPADAGAVGAHRRAPDRHAVPPGDHGDVGHGRRAFDLPRTIRPIALRPRCPRRGASGRGSPRQLAYVRRALRSTRRCSKPGTVCGRDSPRWKGCSSGSRPDVTLAMTITAGESAARGSRNQGRRDWITLVTESPSSKRCLADDAGRAGGSMSR